ncbi:MAG: beta-mannosidase [Candidatus Sumerlaeota bacterium]|nr:beta-mannosidase [Candidatus Sumerlaeota bacterium]
MAERAFVLERNWRFRAVEPAEMADFSAGRLPAQLSREGWEPALIPGSVHGHLMAAGKLEDPFFSNNEKKSYAVESQDFLYKTNFLMPEEWQHHLHAEGHRFELEFESLETFAQIYFNGHYIGQSSNQFVPLTIDVSGAIRAGENVLYVHFEPAARRCAALEMQNGQLRAAFDRTRVYARRAQMLTGWSMAPRLSGCGFWGPVIVRHTTGARLGSLAVPIKSLSTAEAKIDVESEIEALGALNLDVQTTVERLDPVGSGTNYASEVILDKSKPLEIKPGKFRYSERVVINDPVLWWPHGIGTGRRALYRARVVLRHEGNVLDEQETVFGLRKVELNVGEANKQGGFEIRINGQPVFARGATWVPPDVLPGRVTDDAVRRMLDLAAAGNINLLRVWGGGVYESEAFYRRCDELGIMVWQDFMFAQGDHPETKEFWNSVQEEARAQIKRLRNHPSIVLWCGNDANDWMHHRATQNSTKQPGRKIFTRLLPHVIETFDPHRPYWTSSPSGGEDPNSENQGDHHYLGVWENWEPELAYRDVRARFVSRFDFMALPHRETVRSWTSAEEKSLNHSDFESHLKQQDGTGRLFRYVISRTRPPETFDELIYLSQWTQAQALTLAIDTWRANKPETMGAILWHFNDCWPGISASLLDYKTRPKLAYWAVRDAYAPVSLILLDADTGFRAVAVHDGPGWERDMELICRLKSYTLDGELLDWYDHNLTLPANGKTEIGLFSLDTLRITNPESAVVVGELISGKQVLSARMYQPVAPKSVSLPEPRLDVMLDCVVGSRRAIFQVRAQNVVRGVEIGFENLPAARVRFDNAFDIWPSREVWVNVEIQPGLMKEQLMAAFRFRCLNDIAGGRRVEWRSLPVTEGEGYAADVSASGLTQLTRLRTSDIIQKPQM